MTGSKLAPGSILGIAGALVLGLLFVAPGSAAAQQPANGPADGQAATAKAPASRYVYRRRHDPNGIGKFYMGREIAQVMGAAAAPWLERPQREQEESLSKLVEALALEPGLIVADIGAGSGVISLMLAEKVAPEGKVIAVDIQERMLKLLGEKIKARGVKNVEPHRGTEKSPQLQPASIDLALMVDVYHEFAFPYEMMSEIAKAMKPGGRVVLVEYRKEDPQVPIKLVHKMTEAQVKREMAHPEFDLEWKETIGTLPWQHVVVFERRDAEGDAAPRDASP
ncbi:MAG: methyltransferase domain-containing protein [Planctomycetaceae bacterium]